MASVIAHAIAFATLNLSDVQSIASEPNPFPSLTVSLAVDADQTSVSEPVPELRGQLKDSQLPPTPIAPAITQPPDKLAVPPPAFVESPQLAVAVVDSISYQTPAVNPLSEMKLPLVRASRAVGDETQTRLRARAQRWSSRLATNSDGVIDQWEEDGEIFEARLVSETRPNPTSLQRKSVEISRSGAGAREVTRIQFKQLAFSHYTQFIDFWQPDVVMSLEQIEGRFHSNSRIRVDVGASRSARVSGEVTVASTVRYEGLGNRDKLFPGGVRTRSEFVAMPSQPFHVAQALEDNPHIHVIESDARLVFSADGSYAWNALQTPDVVHKTQLPGTPWLIVANGPYTVEVEGTLNGQVALYTPGTISITGNVRYASDPRTDTDADDYLGLVSDSIVEVAGPGITGRGAIDVFASVYAGKKFRVRSYRLGGHQPLLMYGSVTAGTVSATEPRFVLNMFYDHRLEQRRAPYFPVSPLYQLEEWQPTWTLAGAEM